MSQRYKALVESDGSFRTVSNGGAAQRTAEADCIIVPNPEFESEEQAEEWLEDNIRTGHLGPVNVKTVEPDDV